MSVSATENSTCGPAGCAAPSNESKPRLTIVDAVVLGAILAGMLYGIGSYGLYEPHEGHFAGVGREMFFGHDWVTPRLNGSAYLNKPPLFYWLIAGSYALFGRVDEWTARFPLALIGWLGVLLAWYWARELWGSRAGRIAAGILGVSAGWYLFSHQLMIDELLCVFHLASLYFLWKAISEPASRRNWIGFHIMLGLAIMAKGLVGLCFPLGALLCFCALKKDAQPLRHSRPWLGLAIILAIVSPWLILVELHNPGYLKYVIINEHWNRILGKRWPPDFEISKTSIPGFLLVAVVWLAPWSLFLPQIVSFGIKHAPRCSGGKPDAKNDAVLILCLGALLPTLLFVPVPSRLIYYCLPTLPPFAILAAGWWISMADPCYRRGRLCAAATTLVLGAAIAAAGFIIGDKLKSISDLTAAPQTLDSIPGFALTIGVGLILCGMLLLARKTGAAMVALCLCIGVGEAYNTAGFAAFDRVRSSKRMIAELLPHAGPDCIWISEGSLEIGAASGTAFYLGVDSAGHPRNVLVMKDSPRRYPPQFPGKEPAYLIDRAQLKKLWDSTQPALYVTDFLHRDVQNDPYSLPEGEKFELAVKDSGHRRVFANSAARKRFTALLIGTAE